MLLCLTPTIKPLALFKFTRDIKLKPSRQHKPKKIVKIQPYFVI